MKLIDILKKNISRNFMTTMIYPLDQFEQAFGYVWGHGKEDNELTDDELDNKAKWLSLRTRILDNGKKQERNAIKELSRFNVTQPQFKTKFIPRK